MGRVVSFPNRGLPGFGGGGGSGIVIDRPPRVLEVVPAPTGWLIYILAAVNAAPSTWTEPVVYWGKVEWQFAGENEPGTYWEALFADDGGVLHPPLELSARSEVLRVVVCPPGAAPPTWWGGSPEAQTEAWSVVAKDSPRET
jgi:hypothetical protein